MFRFYQYNESFQVFSCQHPDSLITEPFPVGSIASILTPRWDLPCVPARLLILSASKPHRERILPYSDSSLLIRLKNGIYKEYDCSEENMRVFNPDQKSNVIFEFCIIQKIVHPVVKFRKNCAWSCSTSITNLLKTCCDHANAENRALRCAAIVKGVKIAW